MSLVIQFRCSRAVASCSPANFGMMHQQFCFSRGLNLNRMRVRQQPGRTSNSPRQAGRVSERIRCPLQVVRRAGLVQIVKAKGHATRRQTRDRETDRTSRHGYCQRCVNLKHDAIRLTVERSRRPPSQPDGFSGDAGPWNASAIGGSEDRESAFALAPLVVPANAGTIRRGFSFWHGPVGFCRRQQKACGCAGPGSRPGRRRVFMPRSPSPNPSDCAAGTSGSCRLMSSGSDRTQRIWVS